MYTLHDISVKTYVTGVLNMEIRIRPMVADDWEWVRLIYLEGIATGQATFETNAPSWQKWDSSHLRFARLVSFSAGDGNINGWAALAPVSARSVYAGVAEVSVYVAADSRGKGIGGELLKQLVAESEQNGIWTLQASVFPENSSSIALHHSCGFREVGIRERIGQLDGVWRNTALMERRTSRQGESEPTQSRG
jgi:L-amino acid N-acyltransferase YncA